MNETHKGARGVAALLAPRNVAIVGASDRAGSWSITVNKSLTRIGFKGADLSRQSAQRNGVGRRALLQGLRRRCPSRPITSWFSCPAAR